MTTTAKDMPLPTSPNDMPTHLHNDERWIRNLVVGLDQYAGVSIDWERNDSVTRHTGETSGTWTVWIETGRRSVSAVHESLTNALWYADRLADAHLQAVHDARQKARAAAMDKLTPEERSLLGLSM